jgi:D-glycero-D-manno-heptose 1,7-bisphosphate phosphatase
LNLNRAVFLDRDGTLIQEKEYLSRPDQVALFPGVAQALRSLREAGFKMFIVSNQSGIGRGFFTLADVNRVHARLADKLAPEGVRFDKVYVAPEAPGAPSRGRKPLPQFLFDARDEFTIDLTQSYIIGDKLSDLQCGWNAGVKKSILVRTGYGRELEQKNGGAIAAAIVVDDLAAAAAWILQTEATDKTPGTR